jgi:transposase InsO family protein
MRCSGIVAKTVKRYRQTTDSNHRLPVAPNLLARQFTVERPNTVWASDITYIPTSQGWLYLAVVMDLCTRQVVGWSLRERVDRQLTMGALHQALRRRLLVDQPLHHSDRGVQYAAGAYQNLLRDNGITCSMSRRGNCWDNAPAESFFATLKKELVHQEQFTTKEEAKAKIFEYIEVFYNRVRRHSSLGQLSPAQFEQTINPP